MAARGIAALSLALSIVAGAATGQTPDTSAPADAAPAPDTLTGDWGGLRTRMRNAGYEISVTYYGEVLANVAGGVRQGAIYEGWLEMALDVDLEKAVGWRGARFRTSGYQIHGRGLSANYVGNSLMVASNIEAEPSSRLLDLWLQQDLLDGAFQIRAGQFGADNEFTNSQGASNFINATFGWPAPFAANLPSGGPAYPLATPAVRLRIAPVQRFTLMAAVFNGDPAGPGSGNPQIRDASNTRFRFNDDAFVITELAYALNQERGAQGLPGTYKLGAWYHSGRFADQRFDGTGRSLADPTSSGIAGQHRGNFALYVVADQMLWRRPGTSDQGLGAFLRLAGSPGDRNLVSFYVDGGLTWRGLIPGRDSDTLGLAAGYARISGAARGLDRDTNAFSGTAGPVRDYEAVLELTYIVQVRAGLTLQPDLQLIFHPGANAAIADNGTTTARTATIIGLRSTVQF